MEALALSWLDTIAANRTPALYGVRVLKSASAPLAAPVNATKPHVDLGKMCVTAVLTTRTPDRQGDIVDPTGGDFSEHRTNPVVMFHHGKDHRLPIGKAEDANGNYTVRLVKAHDGDLLLGTTYFAQSNAFAQDVFKLVAEDVLRGVSIGFDPLTHEDAVEELGASPILDRPALHFKGWKLLEYSHTPIGVNRDALTVAVQKSLDGSAKMHPVLERILRPFSERRKTSVTGGAAVEKGMPVIGAAGLAKKLVKKVKVAAPKIGVAAPAAPAEPEASVEKGRDLVVPGWQTPPKKVQPKPQAWSAGMPPPTVKNELKKRLNPAAKIVGQPQPTAAPAGVTKAMPQDDDYPDDDASIADGSGDDASDADDVGAQPGGGAPQFDPTTDNPGDDPNLPEGAQAGATDDEPSPTVQALYDAGQGLTDLCAMVKASMKKSEHMKGRKFAAKLCAELEATAADCQQFADQIHSELNSSPDGGTPGADDADQNADEDSGEPSEPPEGDPGEEASAGEMPAAPGEPDKDDEGALVTKGGYSPRRFTYADLAATASEPAQVIDYDHELAARLKALEVERDEALAQLEELAGERDALAVRFDQMLTDLEAGRSRRR